MAFLGESFNTDDLPTSDRSFDPLPEGWYQATITGAELANTKTGTGQYIKIKYSITGPTHAGRVVFGNLNIRNQNPQAESIGRQQLGELMRAIGLPRVEDTDQLIGGSLSIKLTVKAADGQYEASNEVKGFKAASGSPAPQAFGQSQAAPAAQQTAKAAPPWARK